MIFLSEVISLSLLVVVFFIGNNDYSNKTQMAMSKMPPSQPAGTPGPGVRSHYSDRSPVSQGGSVAAAMMRIAKLPRKVEQAPLYEIESAWNEEKRVP